MTIQETIDGLQFTVDMFLFDPFTGETYTEPRNDMDKTTIDACKEAIKMLKEMQIREIMVGDEVTNKRDIRYVVTGIKGRDCNNPIYCCLGADGDTAPVYYEKGDLIKTGRHFPQIAEVLKQMRGEK